jgi:hypothetical protein
VADVEAAGGPGPGEDATARHGRAPVNEKGGSLHAPPVIQCSIAPTQLVCAT